MQGKLFLEFEKVLDNEAQRVMTEVMNKYQSKEKIGMRFSKLVRSLVKPEFKYYTTDIELRCYGLIPQNLEPDFTEEYALVTKEEGVENHLLRYAEYCIESEDNDKDHIQAAKELSTLLIEYCNENPTTTLGLPEIVADNMDALFPRHNDSMDSRATMLFLQSELEDRGYMITSLCPIRLINK